MKVKVAFYSWFKELAGCAEATLEMPAGSSIAGLLEKVYERFPKMREVERSTLIAVGVEYQGKEYILGEADEVSLFPPVQGG